MNFYEGYIGSINEELDPQLEAIKDYRCHHCGRIKLSVDLIDSLEKFAKEFEFPTYIVLGYICPQYCEENGINPEVNTHARGIAIDVHFGGNIEAANVLDIAQKYFPCVGLVKAVTGEYYVHLQYDKCKLYWLCAKLEKPEESEYVYFKDYAAFRANISPDLKV